MLKKWLEGLNSFLEFLKKKEFMGRAVDDLLSKGLLALILIVTIAAMLPSERPFEYSNLTVGSISRDEIIAPFTFPIIKSQETLEKERREAWLSVPPVFDFDPDVENIQKIKLKKLFDDLSHFFSRYGEKPAPLADSLKNRTQQAKFDSLMRQIALKYSLKLTREDMDSLLDIYRKGKLQPFVANLSRALVRIYQQGIIDRPVEKIEEKKIVVVRNGVEEEFDIERILDVEHAREELLRILQNQYPGSAPEMHLTKKILSPFVAPNLLYNPEITTKRKQEAVHNVPPTSGFVYKNQRIVDSHEIITRDIYLKLQSLAQALKERSATNKGWQHALFYLGKYLFATIMVFILGLYLFYHRRRLFENNKMLLLITSVLMLQFLLSILMVNVLGWNYLSIPIILGPMLLSMLLDASVAFLGTIIISLVLGASLGNNFYLAILTFTVGSVALFSVQKIRNRGQMFRAILYITIAYATLNFSYGFIHFESFKIMFQNFLYFQLPNSIFTPTAVFLLIGVFEKLFDVTTDITLLELSDLNHPLLKRLSVEAPGTFHHSIIVGNLAEAAAKEVGANSLLARVGCYYHDIGKMTKPEYFVENQAGATSKHDNLTPTMSCLILVKHVKAGLDLADQYRLPKAVKQFIPEHHGTCLMDYFYHKAKETMDPKDINEDDFRYPGPKPQSKETAIAMLADTVEAAARSMTNPNLQRIRSLVENLIEKRFQEGQLNECDLTLRDLTKIKEAFVPILMGIHHLRIEYPGEQTDEKSKSILMQKIEKIGKKEGEIPGEEKAGKAEPASLKEEKKTADKEIPVKINSGKNNAKNKNDHSVSK